MLNRREMLVIGAGGVLTGSLLASVLKANPTQPVFGGWLDDESAREHFRSSTRRPYFSDHARPLTGSGRNKQVLLWKAYEAVTRRPFSPFKQEIGDCCGQAGTMGAQFLTATQIILQGKGEEWKGPYSVEFTYAGSRVEVGGGKIRRGDGSTGAWTVEFMRKYGVLLRGTYGKFDLTQYRPDLGKQWGRPGVGVPNELEPIAKEHPIKTAALVKSWEEACDAIANGFPVLMCSNIGYMMSADRDGFLKHNGVEWNHAMLLMAIDTVSRRQGGGIVNSWGVNWREGPQHSLGTPAGCFWADAENIDKALRQGDSYALSNFSGYPRRKLDYRLF